MMKWKELREFRVDNCTYSNGMKSYTLEVIMPTSFTNDEVLLWGKTRLLVNSKGGIQIFSFNRKNEHQEWLLDNHQTGSISSLFVIL